ncbi:MAG: alpha/beta fold hydrolase [Bacteroidia bacterium]|nr:alpha/beta fold hydrolase [Bacteroidia bacterium]
MAQKRKNQEFSCMVKEATISFTDTGKGYPNIVLLHGFLESKQVWKNWITSFPKSYRIITIDLPGHGQSDTIGYYHSMELLSDIVLGVLKHIGIRRYFLFGHSMGGYVSLAFNARHPEHLKGLGLIQSTPLADSPERKKIRDKAIKLVKKDFKKYVDVTLTALFSNSFKKKNPNLINQMLKLAQQMSPQSIAASLHGLKDRPSHVSTLQNSSTPCLLLAGESDKTVPLSDLLHVFETSPKTEIIIIPNGSHMAYLEQLDDCITPCIQFIKNHSSGLLTQTSLVNT